MSEHSTKVIRKFITILWIFFMFHTIYVQNWGWLIWEVYMLYYFWQSVIADYFRKKESRVGLFAAKYAYTAISLALLGFVIISVKTNLIPNIFFDK